MWSNEYTKIPFLEKGRDENGLDCWGLVRLIYKHKLDVDLPLLLGYHNTEDFQAISEIVGINSAESQWERIEPGQEKPLDVLIFAIGGYECHVGVVVQPGLMVHCQRGSDTTHCEYKKDRHWTKRLEGIYRHARNSDSPSTV